MKEERRIKFRRRKIVRKEKENRKKGANGGRVW
jgi:hypothetical protein